MFCFNFTVNFLRIAIMLILFLIIKNVKSMCESEDVAQINYTKGVAHVGNHQKTNY